MQSLKYLYRIGRGPSSSHTMGPFAVAKQFLAENPSGEEYRAVLYGSLAKTGKGHMTDRILYEAFSGNRFYVEFDEETVTEYHPNIMDLMVLDDKGRVAIKKGIIASAAAKSLPKAKPIVNTKKYILLIHFSKYQSIAERMIFVFGSMWKNAKERKYGNILKSFGK